MKGKRYVTELLRRPGGLLSIVADFDAVPGAEVIDVELPGKPRAVLASRSVQPEVHPNLAPTRLKPLHRLRVAVTPRARLTGTSGAVVTEDGHLVMESLWDRPHFDREFNPPPRLPAPVRVPGRHASVISVWCHNFHHWMFEALPRLAVLAASGVDYDKLIVPERLVGFQRETLEMAGIGPDRLMPFEGTHLQPDELVWASPLAPFEQPTPFAIRWLRDITAAPQVEPAQRIYLRRRGIRRVTNERDVLACLTEAGFEVLDPEDLSLRDQVARFAAIRFVVGSHGAAFSNAIFSSQLTALELYHDRRINISTASAILAAGHEHWSLMCRRVPGLRRGQEQNLAVPMPELERTLDAMGARS
ncbi:MAG TPA: glycosyltransferase family 61 protein [Solirubrobacteraceae bacterium]|nr:glycosyltransferase family 61 protein [Solirubrobacteraceae bacterium]